MIDQISLRLHCPEPERVSRHGCELSKFEDTHGNPCQLSATEQTVGIGREGSPVYLEREQVAALTMRLVAWLATGSIKTGAEQ